MKHWQWIGLKTVYAVHDRQLAEHGGLDGIRDEGAIESAVERPRTLAEYEPETDAAALAARYLFSIVRNHGFADGNKRTAWVVARLFVMANGFTIIIEPAAAVRLVEDVAAGELKESKLAAWFRSRIARSPH
jgi:death on curing protein